MNKGLLVGLGALVLALVAGLVLVTGGDDGPRRTSEPTPAAPTAAPVRSPLPRVPRRTIADPPADPEAPEAPDDPQATPAASPPDDVDPADRASLPALAPATLATLRGSVFARSQRCFGPRGEGPGQGKRGRVVVRARAVAKDGMVTLEDMSLTPDGLVAPTVVECVQRGLGVVSIPIPAQPDGEQPFVSAIQVP